MYEYKYILIINLLIGYSPKVCSVRNLLEHVFIVWHSFSSLVVGFLTYSLTLLAQ